MYALNIQPLDHMKEEELSVVPENATTCPFLASAKRKEHSMVENPLGSVRWMRTDTQLKQVPGMDPNHLYKRRKFDHLARGKECWFCFDSPKVEKHLVGWVGEETYIALAKGGLTKDHLLLIPMEHHGSSVNYSKRESLQFLV